MPNTAFDLDYWISRGAAARKATQQQKDESHKLIGNSRKASENSCEVRKQSIALKINVLAQRKCHEAVKRIALKKGLVASLVSCETSMRFLGEAVFLLKTSHKAKKDGNKQDHILATIKLDNLPDKYSDVLDNLEQAFAQAVEVEKSCDTSNVGEQADANGCIILSFPSKTGGG